MHINIKNMCTFIYVNFIKFKAKKNVCRLHDIQAKNKILRKKIYMIFNALLMLNSA